VLEQGDLLQASRLAGLEESQATEAAELLLRFGVDHLQLRRISATCHPDNHASVRVLEKAGLEYEGRMRSHLFVRGAWRDSLLYAAVNGDEQTDTLVRQVPRWQERFRRW